MHHTRTTSFIRTWSDDHGSLHGRRVESVCLPHRTRFPTNGFTQTQTHHTTTVSLPRSAESTHETSPAPSARASRSSPPPGFSPRGPGTAGCAPSSARSPSCTQTQWRSEATDHEVKVQQAYGNARSLEQQKNAGHSEPQERRWGRRGNNRETARKTDVCTAISGDEGREHLKLEASR